MAVVVEGYTDVVVSHQYGVEFEDLTPNDRLVLGSLLWFEMHEHPSESV